MIECSRCQKDLTNSFYRIIFGNEILCILCYQRVPHKEKKKVIENMHKGEMK